MKPTKQEVENLESFTIKVKNNVGKFLPLKDEEYLILNLEKLNTLNKIELNNFNVYVFKIKEKYLNGKLELKKKYLKK